MSTKDCTISDYIDETINDIINTFELQISYAVSLLNTSKDITLTSVQDSLTTIDCVKDHMNKAKNAIDLYESYLMSLFEITEHVSGDLLDYK